MAIIKYRVVVDKNALPVLQEDAVMNLLLGEDTFFSCTDVIAGSQYLNMKVIALDELVCDVFLRNEFVLYYTSWVDKNAPTPGFVTVKPKDK